jgi:hypothetical protein
MPTLHFVPLPSLWRWFSRLLRTGQKSAEQRRVVWKPQKKKPAC